MNLPNQIVWSKDPSWHLVLGDRDGRVTMRATRNECFYFWVPI